tara:strand:- start:1467 stop:2549 length:1083 start_codon:yes stop_codon:yes gene_type:complete
MAFYDFIREGIANTGKDLLTIGKNIINPRNIAQTALYTALSGGNKGDYLRNAGIGGLLTSLSGGPREQNRRAKTRRSQVQTVPRKQFQGGPTYNPSTGGYTMNVSNQGIGSLQDGLQTAAFTEGEMINPTPTGGFLDLFGGPTFEGSNPPRSGVFNQGDYSYVDKPVQNAQGTITGYIRDYNTGAQEMLDLDKGYLRTLREGSSNPANFGIGTRGLIDQTSGNFLDVKLNEALLKYLYPDSFRTRREAQDLANEEYDRQVKGFSKQFNLPGLNRKFSRDIAARQYNQGGIAMLNAGGFVNRDGPISGPGTGTSDDIPAMLSDGEFVMTAEAVRNMGNGSREKGTKRMYDLMNNLENKGRA